MASSRCSLLSASSHVGPILPGIAAAAQSPDRPVAREEELDSLPHWVSWERAGVREDAWRLVMRDA
jgi:hypothetical protein